MVFTNIKGSLTFIGSVQGSIGIHVSVFVQAVPHEVGMHGVLMWGQGWWGRRGTLRAGWWWRVHIAGWPLWRIVTWWRLWFIMTSWWRLCDVHVFLLSRINQLCVSLDLRGHTLTSRGHMLTSRAGISPCTPGQIVAGVGTPGRGVLVVRWLSVVGVGPGTHLLQHPEIVWIPALSGTQWINVTWRANTMSRAQTPTSRAETSRAQNAMSRAQSPNSNFMKSNVYFLFTWSCGSR